MATPIKLNYIKVAYGEGEGEWKTVNASSSITANSSAKANSRVVSSWKKISKSTYDNIKNNSEINSTDSGWYSLGEHLGEKRTIWKTKVFKKTTGSGSSKKYYRKTVEYYEKYALRTVDHTYTFTKQPSSINITYQDLDIEDDNVGTDVGRDRTTGKIKRHRVRTNVRTIECEFPMLTQSEVASMMPYINGEYNKAGFLTLNYTDAYKGQSYSMKCYAGDRSMEAGHFGRWLNFKVTFVEE